MNKVEKIKAYLERRIAEITDISQGYIANRQMSTEYLLLFELLSFIDSLLDTEEDFGIKSNDLEEAAHSYVDTTIECFDSEGNPCCYPAFIAGAQWQKERDQSTIELAEDHAMLAGMEKMKEEMMKDVVDGVVFTKLDDGSIMVRTHYFKSDKIDYLDEVKLIIIKEE